MLSSAILRLMVSLQVIGKSKNSNLLCLTYREKWNTEQRQGIWSNLFILPDWEVTSGEWTKGAGGKATPRQRCKEQDDNWWGGKLLKINPGGAQSKDMPVTMQASGQCRRETGFQLAAIHHVAVKAGLCALTFIKSRPQKQNLCLCLIFFALQMDDSPVGFMCRNRKFVSVKAWAHRSCPAKCVKAMFGKVSTSAKAKRGLEQILLKLDYYQDEWCLKYVVPKPQRGFCVFKAVFKKINYTSTDPRAFEVEL